MRRDYDVAVKKREKALHLLENENDTMNTMNQKRYKSRKESPGSREYYRCCYMDTGDSDSASSDTAISSYEDRKSVV